MKFEVQKLRRQNCRDWYASTRSSYDSLTKIVSGTIEGLLKERRIDHLSVTGRAKTLESVMEKVQRKDYEDPQKDIHDFSGVRIIAYIESDVEKAATLIRNAFDVHPDKSLDKTSELGIDRIGYRSFHLVCDLGENRVNLPEYSPYKGMLFEIQIRTVLQHAWAEIEHDRNYKFAGTLPDHLQRRLHLAAGTLEMVDREFDSLAKAIDSHAQMVTKETKKGNLDIPIDTTSLTQFLTERYGDKVIYGRLAASPIVPELKRFGINTLADLDAVMTPEFNNLLNGRSEGASDLGVLRRAMMYTDIDRYFAKAWAGGWQHMHPNTLEFLKGKYSAKKVNSVLKKHKIQPVYLERISNKGGTVSRKAVHGETPSAPEVEKNHAARRVYSTKENRQGIPDLKKQPS